VRRPTTTTLRKKKPARRPPVSGGRAARHVVPSPRLTLVILGRPNVGKSTLFNRLVGRHAALVDNTPGLTRDWREGQGRIGDIDVRVIDTAGLEDASAGSLAGRMRHHTEAAVHGADAALMVIDAIAGVTPLDQHFVQWLNKTEIPTILIANKCEGRRAEPGVLDAYRLGIGEPVAISAEHGEGLADLYTAVAALVPASALVSVDEAARPLALAIVGRPNAGKSTLANRLVGSDRLLTGPEPGITRDAIAVDWRFEGRWIRLVDTAGLRRRARVVDRLERLAAADALRAVRLAEIVVVVLDAETPFERQDQTIARMVAEEGRTLVIALNKCDLLNDVAATAAAVDRELALSLPQLKGATVAPISALTGAGIDQLMTAVFALHDRWTRRVATGPLNRWLADAVAAHPPPSVRGRRLQLRYLTQVKARPPTFALFASRPDHLPKSYLRYLTNALREHFDLAGIPLRLLARGGQNPYVKR